MQTLRSRVRVVLVLLAVPNLMTAAWALFVPQSWYDDFPGRGLGWVQAFGAYNEHFIQDIGSAYLGFGMLFAYAAFRPTASLVRGSAFAYLFFTVPHLLIHIFVRETLTTMGYIGTITPLAFSAVLAGWVALRAEGLEPDRADAEAAAA